MIPFFIYFAVSCIVDPFNYLSNDYVSIKKKELISKKISPHLYKMIDYENNPKQNIILGDSRSNRLYENIKTHSDNWSELSYGAASLNEVVKTLDWIVKKENKIDTILIGISFNLYNKFNKRTWVEETIERKKNLFSLSFSSYSAHATWLLLEEAVSNNEITLGKPKTSREKFWKSSVRIYGKKFYGKYAYPVEYYNELKNISEYCKKKKIQLIFWIPPASTDIRNLVDTYGLNKEYARFVSDIKKLGPTFDFNDAKKVMYTDEDFTDPTHFNFSLGSKIYDEIFK